MTVETNAERLERLKQQVKINLVTNGDFKWLIERAELVDTYEQAIKGLQLAVEVYSDKPVKEAMEYLIEVVEADET